MKSIHSNLIDCYRQRFINRQDAYNLIAYRGTKCATRAVYAPVTDDLLLKHLCGDITLGLPALGPDGKCVWGAWDSDTEDGGLSRVEEALNQAGWRTIREGQRPGRDGHLWLTFDRPVPALDLIRFARSFERAANVSNLEFFPKQASAPRMGSALRGPLSIHRKPEANRARGWFEGPPQDIISQLEWLESFVPNKAAHLLNLAAELEERERLSRRATRSVAHPRTTSGANILELVPESERRRMGPEWSARCPACALGGADTHGDNLRIKLDGSNFCCVEGGPGRVHKQRDIIRALHRR